MGRIAVGVEYDGGAYSGWQIQASAPSVQQQIQLALTRVADAPVEVICAGRTDAGVHAHAQWAHFDTSAARHERAWVLGANTSLPADIALRWARAVPDHFHARYSALSRTYRYLILNRTSRSALARGRAWCVHRPLNEAAMSAAAAPLLGEHDFSAFRSSECQARSPIRRLYQLQVRRAADWLVIEVRANAFLHHMVRNLVGVLVAVGSGSAGPQRAREQLDSRRRASGEATAPAHGLYLWRVEYPPQFGLPEDSAMIELSGAGPWGP